VNPDDRQVIDEQITYYRRRAPEYDATSTPKTDPFAREASILWDALRRFDPRGKALDLACGTGQSTGQLVALGADVTALDSSPEMLELNRRKVGDPTVRYIADDVFTWQPDDQYDVVFFSFWLSHIPLSLFERFWDLVATFLAPGGRVFFIDEGRGGDWRGEEFLEEGREVVRRRLRDGREYRAVKVFWDIDELERRLRGLGWDIAVTRTGPFYWGEGRLAR
jgi:SAM-dependent methyltransferase